MRYAEGHKRETRERVIKAAGRALRLKGPSGAAVAEIMRDAGLTHGGFYAHFPSKDALMAESLRDLFAQSREKFRRLTDGMPPAQALATFIDLYVSASHRDAPEKICPIAALNSDMPRQSRKLRTAFNEGVTRLVTVLSRWMTEIGLADGR